MDLVAPGAGADEVYYWFAFTDGQVGDGYGGSVFKELACQEAFDLQDYNCTLIGKVFGIGKHSLGREVLASRHPRRSRMVL